MSINEHFEKSSNEDIQGNHDSLHLKKNILKTDVLIIGTGLAGCSAAIELAKDPKNQITMITAAKAPEYTATSWAQGGIVYKAEEEQSEDLVKDIMSASAQSSYEKAAQVLAEEGPSRIQSVLIETLGVGFEKNSEGELKLTEEAAHRFPRILYKGDQTGKAIEKACLNYLNQLENIQILTAHTAVDLLTSSHHSTDPQDFYEPIRCVGAFVLNQKTEQVWQILAQKTVLATGGLGQLYLHSTNPKYSRGDGLAMAYRTGARVMNLEYVQFHPTTFYAENTERFLITEAMRGEGAILVNFQGERFMKGIHPDQELAPRDVVARAIHDELLKSQASCVYLDISHKDSNWIKDRFPFVYKKCLENGIDITQRSIPVVPAAHYSCGGVATDLWGKTSLEDLWAAGEIACTGLHGANRLASTSLLEDLVFGTRAGQNIESSLNQGKKKYPEIKGWKDSSEQADIDLLRQDWLSIKHTMWNYVGLIRTPKRLERAQAILTGLSQEVEQFYSNCKLTDALIGLRNAALASRLVLTAATRNKQSKGCHYIKNHSEN